MKQIKKERLLTSEISKRNFKAFIWHASFLAIAKNFMDVDTVIPSMLIKAGGTAFHIGILTTIMIGFSKFAQLLFAPFLSHHNRQKPFLLAGINMRILSLFLMAVLFFVYAFLSPFATILFIFILVSIFSVSGAFANIPFTDILGKSVKEDSRKQFFSLRQVISSIGMLLSAFAVGYALKIFLWPNNYSFVFLLAALFLLIASLGFWRLKEVVATSQKKKRYSFKDLWTETKNNPRLFYYLLSINVMGLGQGLMPFVLLYAAGNNVQYDGFVGHLLIAKTAGMVVSGLVMYKRAKTISYRSMLKLMWVLSVVFPLAAWLLSGIASMYYITFFLGGVFLTFYTITSSGVLLEISNESNRTIYTGITGAGNILPVLFPLLGGGLIALLGFHFFFITYTVIVGVGLLFLNRMNCKK